MMLLSRTTLKQRQQQLITPLRSPSRSSSTLRSLQSNNNNNHLSHQFSELSHNNNNCRHHGALSSPSCGGTTTAVRTFFQLPRLPNLSLRAQQQEQEQPGVVYIEERIMGYSPSQVFEVVANVDNYKLFLPHVKDSVITNHHKAGEMDAVLTVGYPPFYESYSSHIHYSNPHFVNAEAQSGKLFSHLRNRWEMHPVYPTSRNTTSPHHHAHHSHTQHSHQHQHSHHHQEVLPHATRLKFLVEFEFASQWYQTVANMFFKFLVNSMTDAFESRCREVYGPPSIASKKIYDRQITLDEYRKIQQQHKQQQQLQQQQQREHQHHHRTAHHSPVQHHQHQHSQSKPIQAQQQFASS